METSEQHSPETNINNHIPIEILMEILHKIARIGYITYNKSTMLEKVPYEVEVYGLSTGSWRTIQANVPCVADYVHHRPVTFNGSIHWLATRRDDEVCDAIMAFDISNEVFSVLELPDECSHISLMDAVL
ncbi:hypothetical protein ACH5RR_022850 [Cinchona calisaya]|uniref:F-box associated beta-propeller type 1 domain-containing protein n=1 Tax=Cinchona calisaya TaxID=153742 RepID=A0ABD2ZA17_9GENT